MVAVLLLAHVLWAPALAESSIADFVIIGIDHPLDMESTVEHPTTDLPKAFSGERVSANGRYSFGRISVRIQENVGQTQDEERVQVPNALIDDGDGASNGNITIPDGQTKTTLNVPIKLVPLEPKPPVGGSETHRHFPMMSPGDHRRHLNTDAEAHS